MEKRMSLAEVAKDLDVNISTVWRWVTRGVKGRKLKSQLVGGRRFINHRNLSEFLRPADEPPKILSHDEAQDTLRSGGM